MVHLPNKCDKPGCDNQGSKRYSGKDGNVLRLCPKHYYSLVTGGISTPDIV